MKAEPTHHIQFVLNPPISPIHLILRVCVSGTPSLSFQQDLPVPGTLRTFLAVNPPFKLAFKQLGVHCYHSNHSPRPTTFALLGAHNNVWSGRIPYSYDTPFDVFPAHPLLIPDSPPLPRSQTTITPILRTPLPPSTPIHKSLDTLACYLVCDCILSQERSTPVQFVR
jgi:hypothetical protein